LSGVDEPENPREWIARVRARLALRCAEKPATKAGQIRALWPEIDAALDCGQSMKTIHKWLEEEAGLRLSITSLTSYISRIRRREEATKRGSEVLVGEFVRPQSEPSPTPPTRSAPPIRADTQASPAKPDDPLAQAMSVLSKPRLDIRKIHNDGDPDGRNLI
jgi:hypothetical protein